MKSTVLVYSLTRFSRCRRAFSSLLNRRIPMNTTILWRVACLVTITVALSSQGLAQTSGQKFGGRINDYTAALDAGGPWHISGEWSLALKGDSGTGDFSVALNMVRSDNPARAAHTHHVTLSDGDVTLLANGFRITGAAVMTSNGNTAGFSGSSVDIQVTGGNALPESNVTLTFGGAAAAHFGDQPLHGVVTERR
jgi:hypothetical protein